MCLKDTNIVNAEDEEPEEREREKLMIPKNEWKKMNGKITKEGRKRRKEHKGKERLKSYVKPSPKRHFLSVIAF